jgi:H+-transporting ATPase
MIIINETISSNLIVFIALFADLATVAIAYDNAHSDPRPVEWQLPKIWIISIILGIELAIATWVIRGTLYVPNGGIVQNFGNVQEILFLEVALTENWLIFVTRGAKTLPSWQLIGAIFGVDVLATLFCIFGWLNPDIFQEPLPNPMSQFDQTANGHTDVVTVVVLWLYSIGVIIFIAITYYLLNKIPGLADLGRKNRSLHDTQMENIIGHLSKLALQHSKDVDGESRWTIAAKATEEEEDD